jgi:hypothetical protein
MVISSDVDTNLRIRFLVTPGGILTKSNPIMVEPLSSPALIPTFPLKLYSSALPVDSLLTSIGTERSAVCASEAVTTISNVLERGLIITDPDDVSKESDGDTVWNSSVFVSHELNTKTIVNKANK